MYRPLAFALSLTCISLSAPALRAQFEPQNPTPLIVKVCIGSSKTSARAIISVQLQDGFGAIEHEGHTDNRGVVEFSTFTATKRIRIFGPGIVEHEETVEIEPVENRKMVNMIVKEDPKTAGASGSLPRRLVPVGLVKIPR